MHLASSVRFLPKQPRRFTSVITCIPTEIAVHLFLAITIVFVRLGLLSCYIFLLLRFFFPNHFSKRFSGVRLSDCFDSPKPFSSFPTVSFAGRENVIFRRTPFPFRFVRRLLIAFTISFGEFWHLKYSFPTRRVGSFFMINVAYDNRTRF